MNQHFGQFIISKRRWPLPPDYNISSYGPWLVSTHASLSITSVVTRKGRIIGGIIGCAIDVRETIIINGSFMLPFDSEDRVEKKERAIHKVLQRLGGRFVCLIVDKDLERLYLDAAGSLSCVYDSDSESVASTAGLILDRSEYESRLNQELAGLLKTSSLTWYPAGLTPHSGIHRLLPNHYLDLNLWEAIRHWPKGKVATEGAVEDKVARIANTLKATIHTITRARRVYLPVTGGMDSRMLLACARADLSKIKLILFVDVKENIDQYVATHLDHAHNLNIEYLPIALATREQQEQWVYDVGDCIGGRIKQIHQTLAALDRNRVIIPGAGGAVGKHHYWKRGDTDNKQITTNELLHRMGLPLHPLLCRAIGKWLAGISGVLGTFQLLDVAHIENREGAWAGPQTYGQVRFVDHIYPIYHRGIFEDMISLPCEYKFENRLHRDVIKSEWPQLLDFPFNSYGGMRNWLEKARKVLKLPRKVMRGIGRYS